MQVRSTVTQTPPLRAVRLARGLTLQQVGDRAGIDIGHLSRIERGQARISVEKLARVAAVLGLTELERHLCLYATPESAKLAVAGSKASRSDPDGEDTTEPR